MNNDTQIPKKKVDNSSEWKEYIRQREQLKKELEQDMVRLRSEFNQKVELLKKHFHIQTRPIIAKNVRKYSNARN